MKHYDVMAKAVQVLLDNGVIDLVEYTNAVQLVAKQVTSVNLVDAWELVVDKEPKYAQVFRSCATYIDDVKSKVVKTVKKNVSYSHFIRGLHFKRNSRKVKYGLQKGHKPLWRSERSESRFVKRNERSLSYEYGAE